MCYGEGGVGYGLVEVGGGGCGGVFGYGMGVVGIMEVVLCMIMSLSWGRVGRHMVSDEDIRIVLESGSGWVRKMGLDSIVGLRRHLYVRLVVIDILCYWGGCVGLYREEDLMRRLHGKRLVKFNLTHTDGLNINMMLDLGWTGMSKY
ncbi:hypothetical protein Tco_0215491 [Tanacetum coccineum]